MIQVIVTVLFLVFLEGILSFDNALALAAMVRHLPEHYRKRALTYGMWGAFAFRFGSLFILNFLMQSPWVKVVGGAYLVILAVRHFGGWDDEPESDPKPFTTAKFWKMVVLVEVTDIAFSSDSILAAVAVSDKLPIVVVGGILGIIMMRLAAMLFIKLIEKFPYLERTAYLLVLTVGVKLLIEAAHVPGLDFHSPSNLSFWGFWGVMTGWVLSGFLPYKETPKHPELDIT